ncbi:hypothetical protein HS43_08620 [Listeria monocytogenes]|uniref:Uncharacterized protein n=1 Tax=Listeria monocytogenes TaxID=1639 RepID=A0A5L3LEL1_LISMN|nr:hypothetical protein [Listeria monocytogenes]AHJ37457.1 hypothetical protein AX24_12900 [Listeria monocytogenes WSLC1042]ALD11465.1 hypothetical protein LM220_22865 [Listeria monocytogenes J1816]EAD5052644.1 hypothetical protein [Listeria monocytogenes serotype 4b]EFG03407.1 predicted protein [Listeria monocytogenes FSL J1-194]EGC3055229.1 hypothetical protein [Listeria monocytogenes CFSAN002357]EHC5221673.1 hypothetical protein [Listeria monocytogenes serotype 1/2b]
MAKYRTKIDDKVIEMDREILPQGVIDSFLDGNYRTVKTTEEITVYREYLVEMQSLQEVL